VISLIKLIAVELLLDLSTTTFSSTNLDFKNVFRVIFTINRDICSVQ